MANLTQAQRLIWTGQQLDPDAPLYNMSLSFRISGPVDPLLFQTAFDNLVAGTDSLRTTFRQVDGEPVREVHHTVPFELAVEDLSDVSDARARLMALIEAATVAPFDLSTRLFNSGLVKLSDEEWVWWIVQHHLITDGWATAVVFHRMSDLYEAAMVGEDPDLDFPQFQFYADFEERSLTSEAASEAAEYWEQRATQELDPLSFYGVMPGTDPTTRTDRITEILDDDRMARLGSFLERTGSGSLVSGVSLFNVFATALTALLSRVTGQSELAMLAPAHNRPSPRFKDTAGLFIEVLPLHVTVDPGATFTDLLGKVGESAQELLLHARPGSSAATHNRAASVLLNLVNASLGSFNGWPVETEWIHPGHGDRDHALRIQIHDFDETGRWTLHFDVRRDVFDDAAEQRLIRDFYRIFDAMLEDPDRPVSRIDLFSSDERAATDEFNNAAANVPYASVLDGFSAVAAANPDAIAVRCGEATMSYAELDEQADRLARRLTADGGHRYAVCLRRSPELVVALLGILRAGASYVPIDIKYPADRMRLIIDDSGAAAVVADDSLPADVAAGTEVISLPIDDGPETAPPATREPTDLAYVMYTSGSTGKPKGVMVTHGGLANYIAFAHAEYGRNQAVSFPLYSSVGFDLTVTSIFTPLVSGGTVVVYPEQEGADLSVIDVFSDDVVDVVKLTPAHLALLEASLLHTSRIRTLIVGGEDLKRAVAQRAWDASGGALEIINEYGPTEATVGCMLHRYDPDTDTASSVPIGLPARNARIHILDSGLGEAPVGVVGEICIGGIGVAAGYLGRPDLTAASFVADPFHPGEVLYRTGDLARWVAPGRMEFLGRADDQVKVRGHRIELGEVEAALSSHPAIDAVLVDVLESETVRSRGSAGDDLCVRCGLTDAHPDAQLNDDGICQPCLFYDRYRDDAAAYFSTEAAFEELFVDVRRGDGSADCLMLLSGGKDSTYALYQLVEHGLTPLVFSLDNGYISEGAKANIRRAVDDLGLELVWGTTPAMNEIFADSLRQFSNVCQGCFKTVYTLGISLARERGLTRIVTGLSRGQIFETRLADLFRIGITDPDEVDAAIIEARKAYHRMDDAVFRCLDTGIFEEDRTFEEILLVDFYRYFDVGLSQIYGFLGSRAPWVRPSDTGRSTNCLINNSGIFVHKNERGFHNYALPYSWDVRLGHKTRDAALAELDDEIDVTQVRGILEALPYEMKPAVSQLATGSEKRLVGFYVAAETESPEVRRYLAEQLPEPMIPSYLVRLDAMPLTINGKVDRRALPDPRSIVRSEGAEFIEPRNDVERQLADIWSAVLGVGRVSVTDDFFELGGDSIMNIQIVSQAKLQGLEFSPLDLFQSKTIEGLAKTAALVTARAGPVAQADGLAEVDLSGDEMDALLRKYSEDA